MSHAAHLQGLAGAFVLMLLSLSLWAVYAGAACWQRSRPGGWNYWKLASFTLGCGLLVLAFSPPATQWGHSDLRGHMAQHLLLGMFAPIALMLGAPGTLLLRSVSVNAARRLTALLGTLPVRCLTHPVIALLLDIGGLYLLYLTPLYGLSRGDPAVHTLLHLHFLIAGYLFSWSIAGPDPAPRRPGMRTRLAVLFAATFAHSILAKFMYGYGFPRDAGHGLAEIEAAAQLMYYGGDVAELLLAIVFFAAWYRRDERTRFFFDQERADHPRGPK